MLDDYLRDEPSQQALARLKQVNPALYARLNRDVQKIPQMDATLRPLFLEALFGQLPDLAYYLQFASAETYSGIMRHIAEGLEKMHNQQSPWCRGAVVADFLSQNEDELIPALLAEFTYPGPQYDWAMRFMTRLLEAARQGQTQPVPHASPGPQDERLLQQAGLDFGTRNWSLALQIATFAHSEGQSYDQMRHVLASINVCELGVAVHTVSEALPEPVRARLWADLMPQLMIGNTPYALSRITDYFFID